MWPLRERPGCWELQMGRVRDAMLACVILMAAVWAGAQVASGQATSDSPDFSKPLPEEATAPEEAYQGPFPYGEQELNVAASPAAKVSLALPAGTVVRDYEASPAGDEAVVILED